MRARNKTSNAMSNHYRGIMSILLVMVLVFACSFVQAASFTSKGTAAGDILELNVDARAIALGGAYSSIAEGANAIYWNPAGLASLESDSMAFMHGIFFESVNYDYLAYAFPLKKKGVVGVGVQYLNYGSIEKRDNLGKKDGSLTPKDTVMNVSYSTLYKAMPIGITLKFINSKIMNTAATAAIDLGFQMPLGDNRIVIGGTIRNLGGELKYDKVGDPLPTSANLGASYRYSEPLLLSAEVATSRNAYPYGSIGAEYAICSLKGINLIGRGGYKSRTLKSELGGLAGINMGMGVKTKLFEFNYAWTPMGDLGTNHYISMGIDFGTGNSQSMVKVRGNTNAPKYDSLNVGGKLGFGKKKVQFPKVNEIAMNDMIKEYKRELKDNSRELDGVEQFGKAIRLFDNGNFEASYRIFELVNKYSHNNVLVGEAQIGMAESAYKAGDPELSKSILIGLTNFLSGYREDERIKILWAKVNISLGKYDRAVIMLEREESDEAIWIRVMAFRAAKKYARALAEIYYHYEMYPASERDLERQLVLAEMSYAAREYGKAVNEFRSFVARYPKSEKVSYCMYMIASALLLDDKYSEAYDRFSEIATQEIDEKLAVKALFLKAEAAQLMGDVSESMSIYTEVTRNKHSKLLARDAQYRICLIQLQENRTKVIEKKTRRMAKKYSESRFTTLYGLMQYLKGDTDKAYTTFNLALEQSTSLKDIDRNLVLISLVGSPANANALIKRQPASPLKERHIAMFYVGEGFYDQGLYKEAEKIFFELESRAIDQRIRTLAELRYADCLMQQNDYENSLRNFKRIEEKPSVSPDIDQLLYMGLGHVHFKMKDYAKAAKYYELIIKTASDDGRSAQAYYYCGEAYNELGIYSRAIEIWIEMAKKFPSYPKSRQALTDALNLAFGMGNYDQVIIIASLVPELYNDNDFMLETSLLKAKAFNNKKEYFKSVEIYQELISGTTDQMFRNRVEKLLSQSYYKIGMIHPDADTLLDGFAEKYSNFSLIGEVYWQTGAKLFDSAKYAKAEKRFHKVVTEYPHCASAPQAIFYLAESIYWQNRLEDALQYYELYEKNYPENVLLATTARFRMANAYFKQGKIPLSVEYYQKILESGINADIRKSSMLNLAMGYFRINEIGKAVDMFRQFISHYSGSDEANIARYQLARILRGEDRFDEAIECYKQVAPKGNITRMEIAYRIGESYQKKGDKEQTIKAYRKLMPMSPRKNKFRFKGLIELANLLEEKKAYSETVRVFKSLKRSTSDKKFIKLFDSKIKSLNYKMSNGL